MERSAGANEWFSGDELDDDHATAERAVALCTAAYGIFRDEPKLPHDVLWFVAEEIEAFMRRKAGKSAHRASGYESTESLGELLEGAMDEMYDRDEDLQKVSQYISGMAGRAKRVASIVPIVISPERENGPYSAMWEKILEDEHSYLVIDKE